MTAPLRLVASNGVLVDRRTPDGLGCSRCGQVYVDQECLTAHQRYCTGPGRWQEPIALLAGFAGLLLAALLASGRLG